jgi:hypothetical protein
MKTTTRRSITAALFAAILMVALFFNAREATASCTPVIRNNTPADLIITFYNAAGATHVQNVHAFQTVLATWPAGFAPIGIQSAGGFFYPWGSGCTICANIKIDSPAFQTSCAKVCPNLATCTYDIISCASPCAP